MKTTSSRSRFAVNQLAGIGNEEICSREFHALCFVKNNMQATSATEIPMSQYDATRCKTPKGEKRGKKQYHTC